MALKEAVAILNDHRHRGSAGWHVPGESPADPLVFGPDQYDQLEPFEAIAIAEKYAAEGQGGPG